MKKSIRKMMLRGETVRTLQPLQLVEARGGDGNAAPRYESTGTCPGQHAANSIAPACG